MELDMLFILNCHRSQTFRASTKRHSFSGLVLSLGNPCYEKKIYSGGFLKKWVPQKHGFQYWTVLILEYLEVPHFKKNLHTEIAALGSRMDPVGLRTIPTEAFNAERCWTTFFSPSRDVSITSYNWDLQSTCELRTHGGQCRPAP